MPSDAKQSFMRALAERCGTPRKLGASHSLFEVGDGIRVYVRYSKLHNGDRTFYGLRTDDLRMLEGHASLICFLWDGQPEPLFIPYEEFEEVFRLVTPANDGQYKAQVYLRDDGAQLYIAKAGRFNVEGRFGWAALMNLLEQQGKPVSPPLSHWQAQTLLGSIGSSKGFDVWIPASDRIRLDWNVADRFGCREMIPAGFESIVGVLQEVDVMWVRRGSNDISALFEVEHSTPIYSALLRFNDVHLTDPRLKATFSVVANDARHSLFVRQLNRPTFKLSGLAERCTFLEYDDVYAWHRRLSAAGHR